MYLSVRMGHGVSPQMETRILQTRLAVETGWTFEYIESLPLWRVADYTSYKRAAEMLEESQMAT